MMEEKSSNYAQYDLMMAAGKNKNPPTAAINNPKDYSGLCNYSVS